MNVRPDRSRQFASGGRSGGWWRRLQAAAFHRMLDRVDAGLAAGAIEAWLPDGSHRILGGRAPGPVAEVEVRRWRALVRLARQGSVGWYRGWAAGDWASPDPVPLFDLFMRNARTLGGVARARGAWRLGARIVHALNANSRAGARRNIAFHYDLGNDFYAAWLDETMTYSSALFREPVSSREDLADAQLNKVRALLDRLDLAPDQHLLEIGCGWGALADVAARDYGVAVTALTLSARQADHARRINAAGVSAGRVDIALRDYRDEQGRYDAVASVEMVEAVGQEHWRGYLGAIHAALKPGGRAALQYISIDDALFDRYSAGADFIQTHVFPGGMLLSEPRFRALAEEVGFDWTDRHGFGLHYAETLRRWRSRFDAALADGRIDLSRSRDFSDLWRYYLMYCEGGFRGGGIDVAQVTLVRR